MAMKTVQDLPATHEVFIRCKYKNGYMLVMYIQLLRRQQPNTREHVSSLDVCDLFTSEAEREPPGNHGILDIENSGGGLWKVMGSQASHGWGPFLYDIAMELAAEHDVWLASSDGGVSPEARTVWEQYYKIRCDVDRLLIPDRNGCSVECLRYGYRKSGDGIVAQLRQLHQIRIDCCEFHEGE